MLANPIQRYHLLTHLFEESEDPGTDNRHSQEMTNSELLLF